jgi:hypothetical protein
LLLHHLFCNPIDTTELTFYTSRKRSIGNAITITLNDGMELDEVEVEYPVGKRLSPCPIRLSYNRSLATFPPSLS